MLLMMPVPVLWTDTVRLFDYGLCVQLAETRFTESGTAICWAPVTVRCALVSVALSDNTLPTFFNIYVCACFNVCTFARVGALACFCVRHTITQVLSALSVLSLPPR